MLEKKKDIGMIILIILLIVLLVGIGIYAVLLNRKLDRLSSVNGDTAEQTGTDDRDEMVDKWQEGIINYNGKRYQYNFNLDVYLVLGIDKDEEKKAVTNYKQGGQSDALFLVVANKETKELSVISINRNAMTRVLTCDEEGNSTGFTKAQICTQHGFGDGMTLSCTRTVDAVSYLFYKQPINGYVSINMGAITTLNDAVGGVTVEVLQDISRPEEGVSLKKGETVTLKEMEAYYYLRHRDLNEFDSASARLRRQEQYIGGFMSALSDASNDMNKLLTMYDSVSKYIVSNMEFATLAAELAEYEYSEERMYTVPGETVKTELFEEYHVDDKALYQMIIDIFYEEIEEK